MKGRNCRKLYILGAGFIFPATDSHGLPGWEQHLLGSESPNSASNPQNQPSQEPWDPGHQHHPPCLFSDSNCAESSIPLLTALMGIRRVQIITLLPLAEAVMQVTDKACPACAQHVPSGSILMPGRDLEPSLPRRTSPVLISHLDFGDKLAISLRVLRRGTVVTEGSRLGDCPWV